LVGSGILETYRDALEERGIEPGKVEKLVYVDREGRFLRPGEVIELDGYIHDGRVYFIEVKSYASLDDVRWFAWKVRVAESILGRRADRVLLVAVVVDKEAFDKAKELGVDVVCGSVVD